MFSALSVNFGKGNGMERRSGRRVSKRSCFSRRRYQNALGVDPATRTFQSRQSGGAILVRAGKGLQKSVVARENRSRRVICRLRSSISFLKTWAPARRRESICAMACSRFACRTTRYVTLCRSVKSATKEKRSRLLKWRNRSLRDNLRSKARALFWRESPASNPN